MIQITSSKGVFRDSQIAFRAVTALSRADAMGLLPLEERIDTLDIPALRTVLKHVHKAGIGRTLQAAVNGEVIDTPALEHLLEQLNSALEESPAPEYEWERLNGILGVDLLADLVGISCISVRRYRTAARSTPDGIAERLHFLAMIAGDLSGAYNDMGIRQWFRRKRVQLGGRAPSELLTGVWDPRDPGPLRVRELARAITASPAV
jgi:hypothetical protein